MSLNFEAVRAELEAIDVITVKQDPEQFARLLNKIVIDGSQTHRLNISSLTIYANPEGEFPGIETSEVETIGEHTVAKTVVGLLAAGAKFFDAVIYLSLDKDVRPQVVGHPKPKPNQQTKKYPTFDDIGRITKYIFVIYFFIMIRAHPPTEKGDYQSQPMPKFIKTVLSIDESAGGIAEYLATFDLNDLVPTWVRHINLKNLSQEAASRFGLGIAGYRLCSIFNIAEPDAYRTTGAGEPIKKGEEDLKPLADKPVWMDGAVALAKSFKTAGACWDFHPATRDPNLLSKYGNINKNCGNLILECYSTKTIDKLIESKKLSVRPTYDHGHTDFKQWHEKPKYVATSPIFPRGALT